MDHPHVPTGTDSKVIFLGLLCLLLLASGCQLTQQPGAVMKRTGDEIVVAGQFVHTGARVVLWMDPGGYDAYRVERRFAPLNEADWEPSQKAVRDLTSPNRYGLRRSVLTAQQAEAVRGGGWELPLLQDVVDQFVIHYDACGTSRQCFKVLQDLRGLSVHFLLDLDGTIYQTLDLKERAWHATIANGRSVGIEIANIGAFEGENPPALSEWYPRDAGGKARLIVPARLGPSGVRTADFIARPARAEPVSGVVQGRPLKQYDLTPQQYRALIRLTAALCKTFPKLPCDYPRDGAGHIVNHKLSDDELSRYHGLLGHFHIQTNKVDPGPAFQWECVVSQARRLLHGGTTPEFDRLTRGNARRQPEPRPRTRQGSFE
jgi:N-acetyl-anhydromuramyl-L-alanine amidase AmpD